MRGGLGRLADFGLFAPPLLFLLGLAVPPLALAGKALLIPCVMLLLMASMALAEPGRIDRRQWPAVLLLAAASLIGTPILVHATALAWGLDEVGGWLVLVAACPAAGGAALVASLLRLPMRPLLLAQLVCVAALPLTLPLIAWLLLEGRVVGPAALLWRLVLIVGLPLALGLLLRLSLSERRRHLLARPLRGLGVLALCGIALCIAEGLLRLNLAVPIWREALLGLAFASMLGAAMGLLAAGATALRLQRGCALGGAVRHVSLLWAATIGLAPPEGELVMLLGALWTLLLPALLGLRRGWPRRLGRAQGLPAMRWR